MSTTTGPESTDEHAQPYDASGSGMPREPIGLRRVGDFTLTWGESLRWDDRRQRLYFVDCAAQTLHWLEGAAPPLQTLKLPSMPTGLVLAEDGRIVAAMGDGLHVVDADPGATQPL